MQKMGKFLKTKSNQLEIFLGKFNSELSISQQHHLADLLKDTSNYVLVTLVISQILETNIKIHIFIIGSILFLVLLIFSTWLAKKESDD